MIRLFKKFALLTAAAAIFASAVFGVIPAGAATYEDATETNDRLVDHLMIAPSLIVDVESKAQLDGYRAQRLENVPATVILHVDKDMNVVSSSGEKIEMEDKNGNLYKTFPEIRASLKKRSMLTAVFVSDEAQADAFSAWLGDNPEVFDITVVSSEAALVGKVRRANPYIRGAVDYSGKTDVDLKAAVAESNVAKANTLILSQSQSEGGGCFYVQGMFKSVWTRADGKGDFDFYKAVATGAYGVVSKAEDVSALYGLLEKFDTGAVFSLTRPFYNIGHRGCDSAPENTLKALRLAHKGGATHVEVDVKVSSDGQLFIFHDSSLSPNTNATGNPESRTLDALKQIDVTGFDKSDAGIAKTFPESSYEKIASLDDVFGYFKDKDDVIVICEIKTTDPNVVRLLGEKVKEYGMYGKVVSIAFAMDMLERMENEELTAGIPTAYLGTVSDEKFGDRLRDFSSSNTTGDSPLGSLLYRVGMRDRGYVYYSWTYSTEGAVSSAIKSGVVGLTNNVAPATGCYIRDISADGLTLEKGADPKTATFKATATAYNGATTEVDCRVFACEETEDGAEVILEYAEPKGIYKLFSDPIKVAFTGSEPGGDPSGQESDRESVSESSSESSSAVVPAESASPEAPSDGGEQGGCGSAVSGAWTVFALAAAIFIIYKSRDVA